MKLSSRPRVSRFIALGGAILLISASAALGAYYGYSVGAHHHIVLGLVFAGAAIGGELLKPFAVVGVVDAIRDRRWLLATLCCLLACVCVIYSLASELSLAAGSRGDLASSRQAAVDTSQRLRESRKRATAELEQLSTARAAAELLPLISKLRATPGANRCLKDPDGPISRRVCGEVASLEAEIARHERRAALERTIAAADAALSEDTHSSVRDADPLASAVSVYASAIGFKVSPDTLLPWLALVPVLFLELGSALALVVVRAVSLEGESENRASRANKSKSSGTGKPNRTVPAERNGPDKGRALGANVIELLKSRGGKLEGGQRGIARALGLSKSRANELLHKLAAEGVLFLETCPKGTTVQLVTS